jgi:predicted membrane protein
MLVLTKKQRVNYIIWAVLAGIFLYNFSEIISALAIGLLFYFFYIIFKNKNRNGEAHLFSAIILGMEPLIRSSQSENIPYEFGKYAIAFLLLAGVFFEDRRMTYNYKIIFYIILLLPSSILIEPDLLRSVSDEATDNIRKIILFNLSGPLCLAVSIFYFYSRKFSIQDFDNLLFYSLISLIVYIIFLQLKVLSYGEITYSAWGSNTRSSGGSAANQVSVAMGLGILMILVAIYLQRPISGYLWLDILLLCFFSYRGLLTFSRGGVLVPIVSFLIPLIYYIRNYSVGKKTIKTFKVLLFTGLILLAVWINLNNSTGGQLTKRYEGESGSFEATGKRQILTDRDKIAGADLNIFLDYPLMGVGPGMGVYYRTTHGYDKAVAAHVEYSRILAEHGLFGLLSLLLLVATIIRSYKEKRSVLAKTVSTVLYAFGLLTLGHNCMRTAAGAFIIGMGSMVIIDHSKKKTKKKGVLERQTDMNIIELKKKFLHHP